MKNCRDLHEYHMGGNSHFINKHSQHRYNHSEIRQPYERNRDHPPMIMTNHARSKDFQAAYIWVYFIPSMDCILTGTGS